MHLMTFGRYIEYNVFFLYSLGTLIYQRCPSVSQEEDPDRRLHQAVHAALLLPTGAHAGPHHYGQHAVRDRQNLPY